MSGENVVALIPDYKPPFLPLDNLLARCGSPHMPRCHRFNYVYTLKCNFCICSNQLQKQLLPGIYVIPSAKSPLGECLFLTQVYVLCGIMYICTLNCSVIFCLNSLDVQYIYHYVPRLI